MQRLKFYIAIVTFTFLIFSCGDKTEKQNSDTTENSTEVNEGLSVSENQFKKTGMLLGNLEEHNFPMVVEANGVIDVPPENRAVVNATMGGYIKTTPLLVGDVVKKGQTLVSIENPDFVTLQQEYMEIKQQMGYLKSEFERQKTLFDENITSKKNFLKTESEYKSANAKYQGLKKQLEMLHISPSAVEKGTITSVVNIYAPIKGSISAINVIKGTYVSPASAILEIIDNSHIHLELSVFEKDIMKIKKEQKITFEIPEASNQTFEAEVHLIGSTINDNRTIQVHGHLMNEDNHNFLTGMFVNAKIETQNETALALPEDAIVENNGTTFALKLVANKNNEYTFEQVPVKIGTTTNHFTAILNASNFTKNTQFLTKGAFDIIPEE